MTLNAVRGPIGCPKRRNSLPIIDYTPYLSLHTCLIAVDPGSDGFAPLPARRAGDRFAVAGARVTGFLGLYDAAATVKAYPNWP